MLSVMSVMTTDAMSGCCIRAQLAQRAHCPHEDRYESSSSKDQNLSFGPPDSAWCRKAS